MPAPTKAKMMSSDGKVMGTVFWESTGRIFVGYMQ